MKLSELILKLQISRIEDVYYPSDDSFLVLDFMDSQEFKETLHIFSKTKNDLHILDMGCGTGILGFCAIYSAQSTNLFHNIHLSYVDVNPKAIKTAESMIVANLHHLKDNMTVSYHTSDLFTTIPPYTFDIVLFNPPYLPQDDEIQMRKPIDQALYGGPEGINVLKAFFSQVQSYTDSNSIVYFIASSLGALNQLLPILSQDFHIEILQNVHIFFEDISLFRAKKISES